MTQKNAEVNPLGKNEGLPLEFLFDCDIGFTLYKQIGLKLTIPLTQCQDYRYHHARAL